MTFPHDQIPGQRMVDPDTITNLVSWAWGSLSPQPLARFNIHEALVGNDCVVSFLDDLFIVRFGPGLEVGADISPESVIQPITGAYALLQGIAFDSTSSGGMNLWGGSWESIEYLRQMGRHDETLPAEDAPSSQAMLTAIRVAEAARKVPGYRLALRDVLATLRDDGDDAFVFAYRAVSDLARAVSPSGAVEWSALHSHLSTTEEAFRERVRPLQDARDAAAHGDEDDAALIWRCSCQGGTPKFRRELVAVEVGAGVSGGRDVGLGDGVASLKCGD